MHRETDADANAENDLNCRDSAQRQAPEVHQSRDTDDDADHGNGDARDRNRMRDEDERHEQHPWHATKKCQFWHNSDNGL